RAARAGELQITMSAQVTGGAVAGARPAEAARPAAAGVGERTINLTLHVWRQKHRRAAGRFVTYEARDISTDMSFLEMLDVVNEGLIARGEEPIAFDHDLRAR